MKKVVFPALIFFALATILILSPFATNCASSATSVIEFTNDTQEISSKDSTLKISIP